MIAEMLETGAENAIKASELQEMTGHDRRTVFALIERERDEGALICANGSGFYLPANQTEIEDFYRRYTAKCRKMFYTARHFRQAAEQIEGQESL